MKHLILGLSAIAILALSGCNSGSKNNTETGSTTTEANATSSDRDSMNMSGDMNNGDINSTQHSTGITAVVQHYLHIKNALVSDNSTEAATAAKALGNAFKAVDKNSLTAEGQKVFSDVSSTLSEHAEHIATNGSNIKHQREHFEDLSNDVFDLIKATGTSQTLYRVYCPMADAYWLSETKDIRNPYYGSKNDMATCGEIKETINK